MHDYVAPRWLAGAGAVGGNLQTIWPVLFSRHGGPLPLPRWRRERWDAPDGDFVDVDWLADDDESERPTADGAPPRQSNGLAPLHAGVPPPARADGLALPPSTPVRSASVDTTPLLVLFHGLEGSSSSHYAHAFADTARQRGWRFAVPHFRGCSGELNRAPRAYHSGDFEEIGWLLQRFRDRHAGPLLAAGVSLGGNALLRWAEEAGDSAAATLRAVAALSSPIDLAASGDAIGRGFNRLVYTRMFLRSMKPKALAKLAQHPGLFDRDRLLAARDLRDFDNVFTAPLHGFRDTDDYWRRGSAKPHLHRIRVPGLVVNARNDPFVPAASLPRQRDVGRHVVLWQPAHGGHVGFSAGGFPGHLMALPEGVTGWLNAAL